MPLNIISNFAANVAHRNLIMSDAAATNSLAKLSAGTRVLSAKDDAAALAVGSRLAAEIAGLKTAAVNAGQAISMLQVADGAMSQINDVLMRMKSLAISSGSDQLSSTERAMLDTEYQALLSEIDRIAADTEFAGTQLVNGALTRAGSTGSAYHATNGVDSIVFRGDFGTVGSGAATTGSIQYNSNGGASNEGQFVVTAGGITYSGLIDATKDDGTNLSASTVVTLTSVGRTESIDIVLNAGFVTNGTTSNETQLLAGSSVSSFTFKVGTGSSATADDITISVNGIGTTALSVTGGDILSKAGADTASIAVSNAINDVQTYRATIGASQNRLQFAANNLATTTENTEAARSQLLDLDVASEMSIFTSKQILVQAGVSMLAQANQLPQNLLRLFQ
jgi:flagellin